MFRKSTHRVYQWMNNLFLSLSALVSKYLCVNRWSQMYFHPASCRVYRQYLQRFLCNRWNKRAFADCIPSRYCSVCVYVQCEIPSISVCSMGYRRRMGSANVEGRPFPGFYTCKAKNWLHQLWPVLKLLMSSNCIILHWQKRQCQTVSFDGEFHHIAVLFCLRNISILFCFIFIKRVCLNLCSVGWV